MKKFKLDNKKFLDEIHEYSIKTLIGWLMLLVCMRPSEREQWIIDDFGKKNN